MASRRELLDFFNLAGPPFCKESPSISCTCEVLARSRSRTVVFHQRHAPGEMRHAAPGRPVAAPAPMIRHCDHDCTAMLMAGEQLLSVSSSPSTASTQAP